MLRLRHPHRGLPAEQHRQLLQERSGRSFPGGRATGGWITVDNVADQVTVDISGADITPPSKVVDLSAMFVSPNASGSDNSFKISFTSPGDDLDSKDRVHEYTVKYWLQTAGNFEDGTTLMDSDLEAGSSLSPVDGGHLVEITVR